MTTLELLSALSMDLKRSAIGCHRGSLLMSAKFADEALKKLSQIPKEETPVYIQKIIEKTNITLNNKEEKTFSEDVLMYSTLIQNYCVKKMS